MYATAEHTAPHVMPPIAVLEARNTEADFAWRVLEEIDYGLLLVSVDGNLLHANHLGRHELSRERFMRLRDGRVLGQTPGQTGEILMGIERASHGRRQMIALRNRDQTLHVACVPLFHSFENDGGSVLLMLGRQSETHNLALTFFSRSYGLTPAEEAVLKALCEGLGVPEIASAKGVSKNTVRTHVRSLRDKTGINSIRGMIQRVAALPPVVPLSLSAVPRPASQDL